MKRLKRFFRKMVSFFETKYEIVTHARELGSGEVITTFSIKRWYRNRWYSTTIYGDPIINGVAYRPILFFFKVRLPQHTQKVYLTRIGAETILQTLQNPQHTLALN